jgi:hypothetical protein
MQSILDGSMAAQFGGCPVQENMRRPADSAPLSGASYPLHNPQQRTSKTCMSQLGHQIFAVVMSIDDLVSSKRSSIRQFGVGPRSPLSPSLEAN